MAVKITLRGKHLVITQGGRVLAAYPRGDRRAVAEFLRQFLRDASRRDSGGAPQEAAGVPPDRSRGHPPGGDSASTWPDWARGWVWTPHEAEDPATLVG